jgi:hypothetical protein
LIDQLENLSAVVAPRLEGMTQGSQVLLRGGRIVAVSLQLRDHGLLVRQASLAISNVCLGLRKRGSFSSQVNHAATSASARLWFCRL